MEMLRTHRFFRGLSGAESLERKWTRFRLEACSPESKIRILATKRAILDVFFHDDDVYVIIIIVISVRMDVLSFLFASMIAMRVGVAYTILDIDFSVSRLDSGLL